MTRNDTEKRGDTNSLLLAFYTRKVFSRIRDPKKTKPETDPDPRHRGV